MNRFVAGLERLDDLIDAEQGISIQNEHEKESTGCESAVCEGHVSGTEKAISAVVASDAGTVIPRLDGCVVAFQAQSLFPGLFAAPLDNFVERLGMKYY